jgi:flagellar motor protein MotB
MRRKPCIKTVDAPNTAGKKSSSLSLQRTILVLLLFSCVTAFSQDAFPEDAAFYIDAKMGMSGISPVGIFRELTTFGGGPAVEIDFRNLFFENFIMMIGYSHIFAIESYDFISRFQTLSLCSSFGYDLKLLGGLSVRPSAGIGMLIHTAEIDVNSVLGVYQALYGSYDVLSPLYIDLSLCSAVQFNFACAKNFSIFIKPGFTVFLEQDYQGMFVQLSFGLQYSIPLGVSRTKTTENSILPKDPKEMQTSAEEESKPPGDPLEKRTSALEGSIKILTAPFSPDNDGRNDVCEIALEAGENIDSWEVRINDKSGILAKIIPGNGNVFPRTIVWDGVSDGGESVLAGEDYAAVFLIRDASGTTREYEASISIDILVENTGGALKIAVPSIIFSGDRSAYENLSMDQIRMNDVVLDRLAEMLKKYAHYSVLIAGYAVNMYYNDEIRAEKEEKGETIPLSLLRAEFIREALIMRGIPGERLKTRGYGSAQAVVPQDDEANQWKNRRVDFFLIRE